MTADTNTCEIFIVQNRTNRWAALFFNFLITLMFLAILTFTNKGIIYLFIRTAESLYTPSVKRNVMITDIQEYHTC